jgi:kynurenine 3-monooxygenase
MTPPRDQPVNIVGAGLAGALLAVLLARRGFVVSLYDRRPDPRGAYPERGRSINLALAARGIAALERAGLMQRIRPLLVPMRGRMVHELDGRAQLQPYGQREHEVIYSIERTALNRALIEEGARNARVTAHFRHTCTEAAPGAAALRMRDETTGRERSVPLAPTIAADGAGSTVRSSLARFGFLGVREERLDHDYKELTISARDGRPIMEPHALHVWPRGGFMLIALPNPDGSFTATLFLAREGPTSFASLTGAAEVRRLFETHFADVMPFLPDLPRQFTAHPQSQLGTVYAHPWRVAGKVLLLGDAAHAMVPFHGQGMNAAFEDCLVLEDLLESGESWDGVFAAFEAARVADTAAIAQMALENYKEMRDTVRDPAYQRRRSLALQLERRFPEHFIPRYSMVMFHPEIRYSEALRRGQLQERLLEELDARRDGGGGVDFSLARQLIRERLTH